MRSRSSVSYFASLISLTVGVAAQIPPVTICNPEFQGVGVRVANSAVVWGAPGFADGSKLSAVATQDRLELLFEKSNGYYFAKSLNGTNLAVDKTNGELTLKLANPSSKDQAWVIECTSGCSPGASLGADGFVADGCRIKSASTGQCAQVGSAVFAGKVGDAITLQNCATVDSQRYNLITSPFRIRPSPSLPSSSVSSTPWPHQSPSSSSTPWPHQSASASIPAPSPSASVCSPNFENVGVRVANSAVQWGARQFVNNENLVLNSDFNTRMEVVFQQTGFPAVSYVAKSLNGSNVIVGARANGTLYLLDETPESTTKQRWLIECIGGCPGGNRAAGGGLAADNCRIRFQSTGQCAQIASRNVGDLITLENCNGQDNQRFNFQTSPFTTPINDGPSTFASSSKPKAHLADSDLDDLTLDDLKKLMTNSYIVIGLLAAVLLALLALVVTLLSRSCMKGRSAVAGKTKYSTVARGDLEGFDAPKRYSD
ncbi:hypothetical protein HGRIS_008609 [Hohenbuehelia grisea]|uniref:Ricin B lectin domain-containing protein n=1 Tax=Hohenbuehelia grisea TaxID=104357 RepID=A0ABR3J8Z2_9AGAR